jgi:hypothetical protein
MQVNNLVQDSGRLIVRVGENWFVPCAKKYQRIVNGNEVPLDCVERRERCRK